MLLKVIILASAFSVSGSHDHRTATFPRYRITNTEYLGLVDKSTRAHPCTVLYYSRTNPDFNLVECKLNCCLKKSSSESDLQNIVPAEKVEHEENEY